MTKPLSVPAIKKQLKTQSTDELIAIIMDCYKLSEDVKKYIHVMMDPEGATDKLYEEAKQKIMNEFFPNRGAPKMRYSFAKKAISEFGKLSTDVNKLLDLMITYVETGVQFTDAYGDIDEPFYNSMQSMYNAVMNKIDSNGGQGLFLLYNDRLKAIVRNTDGMGWGFHDSLCIIYDEAASEYGLEY
jgi:hypothetical protein